MYRLLPLVTQLSECLNPYAGFGSSVELDFEAMDRQISTKLESSEKGSFGYALSHNAKSQTVTDLLQAYESIISKQPSFQGKLMT